MKHIYLLLLVFLSSCTNKTPDPTYLEMKTIADRYKVGDVITVDRGFYIGCHLKVDRIQIEGSTIFWIGKSKDCPELTVVAL